MREKNTPGLMGIVIVVAGVMGVYLLFLPQLSTDNTISMIPDEKFGWKFPVAKFPSTGSGRQIAYSDIRDPGGIPRGLPVRLKIPIISVDSAIEDALITPDGRMDVPLGSVNVAWFSLGPPPGQIGSAVIGGHFGITNDVPFVFYNLDKLIIGDKIYITNDKGATLPFVVREIKSFNRDADATVVFTSNDGLAHLNLITCEGVWNKVNDTYPSRLVIFTDAIPIGSNTSATTIFQRLLSVGAQGADVAALQTTLEQKGFLVMPYGITRGYFGTRTREALTRYQTSVNLPPVGIFGPLTKSRIISEFKDSPSLPSTAISPSIRKTPSSLKILMQSASSLYETPVDVLITSLLLAGIVFVIFKIIW